MKLNENDDGVINIELINAKIIFNGCEYENQWVARALLTTLAREEISVLCIDADHNIAVNTAIKQISCEFFHET